PALGPRKYQGAPGRAAQRLRRTPPNRRARLLGKGMVVACPLVWDWAAGNGNNDMGKVQE
ncbi:hypothetical protein, partial [uncultured Desulfovibrio sp.]|uniref:hypothetical protein n=1 Tax=uncultured Desulfovibrio sp. TaxID=167968 RepID=UPI002635FB1D